VRDETGGDAVVAILDGADASRRVEIRTSVTVGRGENVEVALDDGETSRRHAVIRRLGDRLEIEDLGSLNGTWVNGEQIGGPRQLAQGDVIKVGATRMEVVAVPPPRPLPPAARPEPRPAAPPEDELRPVTALFADIVGSTALAERLPPEELKALVGGCIDRMCRVAEEFGGVIDAYMGDGIAAFFGFPAADEHDAERGARAALRIVEVIAAYAKDVRAAWELPDFNVRVGVNSGQVAVGVVGAGERHPVALGDTMSVAARLQAGAQPGTIVIGGATERKLRGRFLTAPLGQIAVKGREAPVEAWRLLHARPDHARSDARPLVGRKREAEQLAAVADAVRAGRGQILMVQGEPGIGKTCLLDWFRGRLGPEAVWLEGHCPSYGGRPPYSPFIESLRGWLASNDAETGTSVLEQLGVEPEALPYLAMLLSGPLEKGSEALASYDPPDELGPGIRRAYGTWLTFLCERGPVVLALHDLHWADPSSLELAESLLELVPDLPLVIATTNRPEPRGEGWRFRRRAVSDHPHRSVELILGPLGEEESAQLLAQLAPGELAEDAKRQVLARAEGNPLYLEQLLRSLLETGSLSPRRTWALTVSADRLPTGLESLLIARVDALPASARRVAQVAAVIGRTFLPSVLARVADVDDLEADIAQLLRADIIREVRPFPNREYVFTHGLLQEAALSTLTRPRRRQLYGLVAAACEQAFADSLDEHLERLAFYRARSGDLPLALNYLERAADRAAALDATTQSVDLWTRAAGVAQKIEDADAQRRIERRLSELRAARVRTDV
jgi:class 3 adenylate cyclase